MDLFFLLSGFILNHVYSNSDQISWKGFYKSRIARVFPLYYLTLIAIIGISVAFSLLYGREDSRLDFGYITQNLLMLSGWLGMGSVSHAAYNDPSWSVCVEVFLYFAIFPVLFLTRKRIRGLFTHLALIALLSLGVSCVYVFDLYRYELFYFLPRGICGFMAGFYIRSLFRHYSFPPVIIRLAGITGLLIAAVAIPNVIPRSLLPLAFPLIVFATATDTGIFCKIMKGGVFQYLGDRSYSIYLWHWPVFELTNFLFLGKDNARAQAHAFDHQLWTIASLMVLAVVSELSYRYFECPMRDRIRKC